MFRKPDGAERSRAWGVLLLFILVFGAVICHLVSSYTHYVRVQTVFMAWDRLVPVETDSRKSQIAANTAALQLLIDEGQNLGGIELKGLTFSTVRMRGLNLDNTIATDIGIHALLLDRCSLDSSKFTRVRWTRAAISNSTFANIEALRLVLDESTILGSSFTGASLTASSIAWARLDAADFSDTLVDDLSFYESSGLRCVFDRMSGDDVQFLKATMPYAKFRNVNLANARFEDSDLTGVDFSGAKLFKVDFSRSKLARSIFVKAELENCQFDKSDLRGAKFDGAIVASVSFDAADLRGLNGEKTSFVGVKGLLPSSFKSALTNGDTHIK